MPRIRGAVVLITGASSGIGEATALALARRGAHLALCARRLDRLQAVAEGCRRLGAASVVVRRADVGRRAEARGFVAAALRDFDRVDVLINNAGIGWRGRLQDLEEDTGRSLIDTNLLGLVWTSQAVLPAMLAANRGVIINLSSVLGFRAAPYSALYSASKHAVAGLSHALRGELSGTGVKVCTVYPGTTRSEFYQRAGGEGDPVGWLQPTDWVARAIVNTIRWPRRDVIILPYRIAHLLEPLWGGLLDHALGEAGRRHAPVLAGPGSAQDAGSADEEG